MPRCAAASSGVVAHAPPDAPKISIRLPSARRSNAASAMAPPTPSSTTSTAPVGIPDAVDPVSVTVVDDVRGAESTVRAPACAARRPLRSRAHPRRWRAAPAGCRAAGRRLHRPRSPAVMRPHVAAAGLCGRPRAVPSRRRGGRPAGWARRPRRRPQRRRRSCRAVPRAAADDLRQRRRRHCMDPRVDAGDAGERDIDQDVAGTDQGRTRVLDPQDVGSSEVPQPHRTHRQPLADGIAACNFTPGPSQERLRQLAFESG